MRAIVRRIKNDVAELERELEHVDRSHAETPRSILASGRVAGREP